MASGSEPHSDELPAQVDIARFAFDPFRLDISVGGQVAWTNYDLAPHTATGPDFDTGRLAQGESATVQFTTAGRYPYTCLYHANMAGLIVVSEP